MNNKISSVLWGIVLVALGAVWGAKVLGLIDANLFFPGWWTLFIIVPCTIGLIAEREKTGNAIGLLIGILLLLGCLDVLRIDMVWRLMLPAVLVVAGAALVFKSLFSNQVRKHFKDGYAKTKSGDFPEYWATFSGQKVNFKDEEFNGCRAEAVFGGMELDLRWADIKDGAVIKAGATFGGVKILLPPTIEAKVVSNSIFGGVNNRHEGRSAKGTDKKGKETKRPELLIDATSVFGGVEVK